MTALHQYVSAVGSFQGILLFFLLVCNRNNSAASKVLGLYSLCMGLSFFLPFITFGLTSEVFYPLAAWLFFIPLLYGALLYLYCSKVVFNAPFKVADLVHLTPLLACYLLNLDALFLHHEELRLWIVGAQAPTLRVWFSEYILFAVAIAYLLGAARLLKRYHQQASDTLSNFDPTIFKWLGSLVSSFIAIILIKGIMAFSNFNVMTMLVLSDALIVLVILVIALTQWKNPEFFQVSGQETQIPKPSVKELNNGLIDGETRSAMFEEVVTHIEQECSYRDSELSLGKLADSMGFSPHHLSEVLNQYAGKNFNQFINEYRVKEVCETLDIKHSTPVLDIAMQAGFSSKSTFNTLFKKYVGLTPTQYRQKKHGDA